MVHKTPTSERIKQLLSEARSLDAAISAAAEQDNLDDIDELQECLRERRAAAHAEAKALQNSGQARLEDLSVFKVKKATRKGTKNSKKREYWYSAWAVSGKRRTVYFGSCEKISYEEALDRAKNMKAKDLGIMQMAV
jgi:hypothetical protein